jgi:hypothetical protein
VLLEQQEVLHVEERRSNKELKNFHLKMVRLRNLTKNLLKARRLLLVSIAQLVLFEINMMSFKRHTKILKCNLMVFGQAPQKHQVILKLQKLLQAKVVKDVIILILMLFVTKANHPRLIKCLLNFVMKQYGRRMIT